MLYAPVETAFSNILMVVMGWLCNRCFHWSTANKNLDGQEPDPIHPTRA